MSKTVQEYAAEARKLFSLKARPSGEKFWSYDHDTAPEWIEDLCREAHGDMLPDDWRYAFIVESLNAISEADDLDEIEIEADTYTSELADWLSSNNNRLGYCDDYAREFCPGDELGMFGRLQGGQWMEKQEVLNSITSSLQELADNQPLEDDES